MSFPIKLRIWSSLHSHSKKGELPAPQPPPRRYLPTTDEVKGFWVDISFLNSYYIATVQAEEPMAVTIRCERGQVAGIGKI